MAELAIISRTDAKAAGLRRYFTGEPCYHGHVSHRNMSNGGCAECCNIRAAAWSKGKGKGRGLRLISGRKHQANYPEIARARTRKWHLDNPDASRALNIARRVIKMGIEGRYTKADVAALVVKQHNECLCGASFNQVKRTIDHIVPVSRGGSNWPHNIQLLCGPCNNSKHTRLMSEWVVPKKEAA